MSGQIAEEGLFLLHSFLLGILITLMYDLFRILRRIVPHGIFLISLEDLIFWILATVGIFYLLLLENNGMFRWFAVIGSGAGMLLYRKTLSGPFVALTAGGVNAVLHFLGKALWKLSAPLRFLGRRCALLSRRAAAKAAREARIGRRRLNSRLTAWRRAVKMKISQWMKKDYI